MSILSFLTVHNLFAWVIAVSPGHPETVPGFLVEIRIRFLINFLETSMQEQEQVQGADYVASKSILPPSPPPLRVGHRIKDYLSYFNLHNSFFINILP